MFKIENTMDKSDITTLNILVYGRGGVGKSTLASTFPKALMLDFENGSKYFKSRNIKLDVVNCTKWLTADDKKELADVLSNYESIIIDPIGEAMSKLIDSTEISGSKYRQSGGDLTIAGWGEVKNQMRSFIKWLKSQEKNIVIIAHVEEKIDNDQLVLRPLIATKIRDELYNLVDVVGYLDAMLVDGKTEVVLHINPADDKKWSKDRTGKLPEKCEPTYDFLSKKILDEKKFKKTKKDKDSVTPEVVEIPEKKEIEKPVKIEKKSQEDDDLD